MDNAKLNMILNIVKIGIMALGVTFTALIVAGSELMIGAALQLTYIVLGASAIAAILFGITHFVKNLEHSKKPLIGLVVFFGVLLLGFIFASDVVIPDWTKEPVTESTSKFVGAGLISLYLFMAAVVGTILFVEVNKITK
jgi:hypothetical protein